MQIIFMIKGNLEKNVPIITQITVALEKKYKVCVICTDCNKKLRQLLENKGASIYCSLHKVLKGPIINKLSDWISIRIRFVSILKELYAPEDLIYIGSLDTAIAVGKILLKYRYVLHIRELYDKFPHYLRLIKPYAHSAKVVIVPEYCRAMILKCWLELNQIPTIIPNKPFEHPRKKFISITDEKIKNIIDQYKNKKIILYQGNISRDRDISDLIRSLSNCLDDNYVIIVMGKNHNNYLNELKLICPNICHIDYVPAPFHLQITSHAYIGLVTYDENCLNNIFCAPNKIYEYSGFGIPVLGSDIPGLRYTIGNSNAGICVNFSKYEDVKEAVEKIESNYDYYKTKACVFFDSVDISKIFDEYIEKI